MSARPGTRRGREETSVDGSPVRPSTRGKGYLEEPAQNSLQRPTSKRGPHDAAAVFNRTSAPFQQHQGQSVQPQRQKDSSWRHAQQQAPARDSGGGHLQEDPLDMSVSLSDLDAMGSTLSIGADFIKKTSVTASASRTAALQPLPKTGAGNPVSSSSQRTAQLQGPALEVLRLDGPKQQSPATPAAAGRTAITVPAAAPVVEPSISYTMSESPAYSDDFLSIEGSGVEIEYSEPFVAAPTHGSQQHGQSLGPGHVGSSSSQTAVAANTPVQLPPRQLPAAAAARSQPYSITRLSADDSAISADIEFSSNSVIAGVDTSPAATAAPAVAAASNVAEPTRSVDPLPMGMSSSAPAAAISATASRLTAAPGAGRRVAGSNLQLADDDSILSYGSAEIEFEPSVAAVSTGPAAVTRASAAGSVLVGQHAAAVGPDRSPARSTAAAPTGVTAGSAGAAADEAATATDELFAMLLAVPKRHNSSSSSSSSGVTADESVDEYSRHSDAAGPTLPAGDSPKGELCEEDSSSHSSRPIHSTLPQHIAAAAALDDAQPLPSAALDVLTGLQELHGTLQVVRQLSLSSSDASSTTEDSGELSVDLAEQRFSHSTHDRIMRQQSHDKSLASPDYRSRPAGAQSRQVDAAAAAAETSIPILGSLQALKHQRLSQYLSTAKVQQGIAPSAGAAEEPASGITQQQQQQQQGHTSYSHSSSDVARQQGVGAEQLAQISSQTISVDIDDLLRHQPVAAAAVGSIQQARTAPVTAASTAKRRSVALQVGSSNDKGTQVMFDESRQLLWDGGCLIQQQRQQQQQSAWRQPAALSRGLATTLTPPAVGTRAIGGASGPWSGAAAPSSSSLALGRLGGVSAGSCWSVLSAALQQFRAAALLDQLEGLLRTAAAGQQTVAAVPGPESGQPLLQQQQQAAVSGRSASAAVAAASFKKPAAAEWVSAPAEGVPQEQQQQQQEKKSNQQRNSRHQADGPIDAARDSAGAWMTLPFLGAGAAAASTQHSRPVALDATSDPDGDVHVSIAAEQQPPSAAVPQCPPAAADSGWFSLPFLSTEKPFLPAPGSSCNRTLELHSVTAPSSTSDKRAAALAEVNHDVGWFSLPAPANTTSGATAVAPKAAKAAATTAAAAENTGWFSLPVAATAVAAPAAAAATIVPDDDTGWFSLPGPAAAVGAPQPPAAAAVASQEFADSLRAVTDSGWMALPYNAAGTTGAPAAATDTPSDIRVSAGSADAAPYGVATEHSSSSVSSVSTGPDLNPTARSSPYDRTYQCTAANLTTAAARVGASDVDRLSSRQEITGAETTSSLGVSGVLHQNTDAAAAAGVAAHQQYTSDFEDVSDSIAYAGNGLTETANSGSTATAAGGGGADSAASIQQYTSDFEVAGDLPELRGACEVIHPAAIAPRTSAAAVPAAVGVGVAAGEQTDAGVGRSAGQVLLPAATGGEDLDQYTAMGAAAVQAGPEVTPPPAAAAAASGASVSGAAAQRPAAAAESNSSEAPLHPATQAADIGLQDQHQQHHGTAGVDAMLRYLTYLDSVVTQGLAPPGLTLATAKSLRDTLLQTITALQQQLAGLDVYALPTSQSLQALGATTAAAGAGGAGDLYYEDLVATCCLDSFMSSSLSQLRRKLARPVVRTAWGADTGEAIYRHGQLPGGSGSTLGKQATALNGQSAAQSGGEQKDVGSCAARSNWAVPGRQRMFSGRLELPSRPSYRYTTLEDTLKLIRQHRAVAV